MTSSNVKPTMNGLPVSMKKQIARTSLVAEGDWDSEWTVTAPDLAQLKRLFGMPLLVEFCRCAIAADRLVSLGDFGLFNDQRTPRLPIAHARNLQTMFWLTCGTIHEAIKALAEMERLGIEGLLGSLEARKPWIELRSTVRRWNDDPIYKRVRNKIAFHIDRKAIQRGINRPGRDSEPVVWKRGNRREDRSTASAFAQDCLISQVFPMDSTEEQVRKHFADFAESVRDVHLRFSTWVQSLFVEALRGAELGLKSTPAARPAVEGLSDGRLREIEDLRDGAPEHVKDAMSELLVEVRWLRSLQKRRRNDADAARARQRTEDSQRRLYDIAATARQYLLTRSDSAENRLRELLGVTNQAE